ncbi:MAG: S41 family peptidase [Cyanobacteria bacterium SZAS LIN-2]|nr:S41 family peptidase [Cyanobacteria bacterium SZAS LIN-2]MBS2006395.1 S41 family peptidase [Cyanobacteria bacterium SZAS TMP-1]
MWWKQLLAVPVFISLSLGGSNAINNWPDVVASTGDSGQTGRQIALNNSVDPEKIYHRVWKLVDEDYYEITYNGQNWTRWEHKYDGKLKNLDDAHRAVETMLASLGDRYTRFLDRDAFDDEKQQIDAKLYGIGVQIGIDEKSKHVVIIAPIDDTPASRAGLLSDDEITEIDGTSTKGFSVEDAAKQIRGAINTPVNLLLTRGGKQLKVTVVRAEIPIKAVPVAKVLDGDVGYIRLSSFISQQAGQEMKDALNKMNSTKGIILDLRDNPGGLLTNAIEISDMFLDKGNIVSTVDRDGYTTPAPSEGHPICRKPMVVLINKGSASASEITSGALHDNNRAMLVGEKTFGKGLVQGINKLEDGSGVNVTIARYLTPNDTDINKKGISPDILVKLSDNDLKEGKGAWFQNVRRDSEDGKGESSSSSPREKRSPDDGKDLQLKAALEVLHKKIGEPEHLASKPH